MGRMSRNDARGRWWLGAVVILLLLVPSIRPISSYDYFWHLATGRWIADHDSLPRVDPFALASHQQEWINGEWLFQIAAWWLWTLSGHHGISVAVALGLILVLSLLAVRVATTVPPEASLLLILMAWLGALHRVNARPETAAMALLVLFLAVALRPPSRGRTATLILITALWINVHPSALLAPGLAGLILVGELLGPDGVSRTRFASRVPAILGCTLALLVNPYLIEGVTAPLRLALFVQGADVTNTEWLPSSPSRFPVLYLVTAGGVLLLLVANRRAREHAAHLLIFVFLAILAIRFVRNHGFFYWAMPLLLAPAIPRSPARALRLGMLLAGVVVFGFAIAPRWTARTGVDDRVFPIHAVRALRQAGLPGNIYNPDQLGGYLIWSFYPERRVLTDGRNELHRDYIREYGEALKDSRAWRRLLDRHRISLAVEEYRDQPLEVINAGTGERTWLPPSLAYFPRNEWALIAFDDVAMVFARRDAYPADTIRAIEYESLVPDATSPATAIRGSPDQAIEELARAESTLPGSWRLARIRRLLAERPRAESPQEGR